MVALGATRRPHGLRGGLKVHSFSGETAHFRDIRQVELRRDRKVVTVAVVRVEIHHQTPVIFLEGINTPEEAQRYSGWEVWAHDDHAAPLADHEYYVAQLTGMELRHNGVVLATVEAVYDGAQAPLLEVILQGESHAGQKRLVPFMAPYIGAVDSTAGVMELEQPWVLDIG